MEVLIGILLGALVLAWYFMPCIVASSRHHRQRGPIFILNLFLGWTGVFWIICLAWSFSCNVEHKEDLV